MLNIDDMSAKEIRELLHKVGYGHLGFIYEGKPSVIPMHYYLEGADIYLFTTEGMKTYGMDVNPEICLQVEEVQGSLHWRSVMIEGRAERITNKAEIVGGASSKKLKPQLAQELDRSPFFSPVVLDV